MKKILIFITSWKFTLVLIAAIGLLFAFELSYDFIMINFIWHVENENPVRIGSSHIKIPDNFGVVREDYFDGTDSLNAIFLAGYDKLIAVSGLNFLSENSNEEFRKKDFGNTYIFRSSNIDFYINDICGDTSWCFIEHRINEHDFSLIRDYSDYKSIEAKIYIPIKGLFIEINGKDHELEDVIEIIRKMVYYNNENFYWNIIG